jgi:5-bromo-4-chloroindolyl phosphate hydrolysis protein
MPKPPPKPPNFYKSFLWMMISMVICAVIGIVLLAELRAGLLISGIVTLAAYFGLTYGLPNLLGNASISPGSGPHDEPLKDADPRVELLVEAHRHLQSIEAACAHVPLALGDTLSCIVRQGRSITQVVTAAPEKLQSVVRFFTYYLPATADLVEDRLKLGTLAGTQRLQEIDQTLERLSLAFGTFERGLLEPDLESVDMDIQLLDRALDDDLRDVSARKQG